MAVSVLFLWWAAPPAPQRLDVTGWEDLAQRTIPGAYHIHTTRSDGHRDRAQIAADAADAGLKFIILTDHGDGTRPPDPPAYIDGVLVLDGVEISTDEGHYVAIDMARAPYPLGGTGASVVEDVKRLGGFGIAAHPDSPKPALRWTSTARPQGIEWLNLDSEWRDETRMHLVRAGIGYILRQAPALTLILDRPTTLDARWPALLAAGPTVALAAADAHGGVGRRAEDPGRNLAGSIGIPGYEASFAIFSNRVILDGPLSGDAAADARRLYAAIRKGSVFSAIDAQAGPALLDFRVETGFDRQPMGAVIPEDSDATLVARANVPAGSEISIVRNGRVMTTTRGVELRHVVTGGQGSYRVEVLAPGAHGIPPVPWLVSNAIYFGNGARGAEGASGAEGAGAEGAGAKGAGGAKGATPIAPFPWRIEKDASSSAILRSGETDATLEYKLGAGERNNQFVALATDVKGEPLTGLRLELSADRPARIWVQVRTADGRRWGRTYYVDPAGTTLEVPIADLRPLASNTSNAVDASQIGSILLVADLTNAAPGRAGILHVRASALIR